MLNNLSVYCYKVGNNLNRVYRTCEAFGVQNLYLVECDAQLSGNLFRAKNRVNIHTATIPDRLGLLALETYYNTPVYALNLLSISSVIIGGETVGLPKKIQAEYCATIPQFGLISGLTVEAALAIVLYEIIRQTSTY